MMEDQRYPKMPLPSTQAGWIIGGLLLAGTIALWSTVTSRKPNIEPSPKLIAELTKKLIV